MKGAANVSQVVEAADPPGRLPRRLHGWQQQRRQAGDDRNDDEHLDQADASTGAAQGDRCGHAERCRAHAPPRGSHAGARHLFPAGRNRTRQRPRTTVPAIPPSRSGEPMTPGRSSDFQTSSAACLLAESRVVRASRNGLKRPTSSPGHSGGAVPDSHRSSLFAGRASVRAAGHQRRWQSVGITQRLSNKSPAPAPRRRVSHSEPSVCQTLRVARDSDVNF